MGLASLALVGALLVGVFAPPAGATTLDGEILFAAVPGPPGHELTVTCDATAGTLTFHAAGAATAPPDSPPPHAGTFVEDGAATFNPLTGTLLSFDATFSITSASGNVTGEKHLIPGAPVPGSVTCEFTDDLISESICYRADFAGGGTEVGRSGVDISFLEPSQGQAGGTFFEVFVPDATVACGDEDDDCPAGNADDEDNDGLNNHNESLFLTLLGNPDSDLDGVKDGNDDSNGNGEDDEDEDDDDDGCPDPDDDGDGVDDEDEDDD